MPITLTTRLRRSEAARFLTHEMGVPCSVASLSKFAWKGSPTGRGPAFRKFGKIPLYEIDDLKKWAEARLTKPITTTSELSLEEV